MNIKRAFLVLAAALLMPGLAMAGTGIATFTVDFGFDDGNPAATTAYISCTGGLPIKENQEVTDGSVINFLVEYPSEPTNVDCRVWVDDVANYTTDYECGTYDSTYCDDYDVSDNNSDGPGCFFEDSDEGDVNECEIDLDADDAFLTITKTWNVIGNNAKANLDSVDFEARIRVCAEGDIILGAHYIGGNEYCVTGLVSGPSDDTFDVTFTGANFLGNTVSIWERTFDSAIEADISDCVSTPGSFPRNGFGGDAYEVFPGDDNSCTIENTVFYEGIPTLNQYGLAIMVLLMLGVGFVGFRRFV